MPNTTTSAAPSMTFARLQTAAPPFFARAGNGVELWLERERDQMALWLPALFGTGIAAWFVLPNALGWRGVILLGCAVAAAGLVTGHERRISRLLRWAGLCLAAGCALIWWRAESVAARVLDRPQIVQLSGTITRVDAQIFKQQSRLWIKTETDALPPFVRVTVKDENAFAGMVAGTRVGLRARLVPPSPAAVPGGYDFSRSAWFLGLGATGSVLGKVIRTGTAPPVEKGLRERLSSHVRGQLSGSAGGIAAAFASGDRGGISAEDEEAMRASGLTHLLSISGLHITAVVAATIFAVLRLLALSPALALRLPLPIIAAGVGALAGVGYTLLTGAEVPTIRSCVAALLVLGGMVLGREAITLRLVATGAIIVLLLWPESLVGPSFQLSFAAITVIVALHEHPVVQQMTLRRDEAKLRAWGRAIGSLLLTGLAVEIALAPIALFHFHKSGVYGALANVIAIPLTTFVTMPLEALALAFDLIGLGAPFWWLTGLSLDLLLWLARTTAALPGAVAVIPEIPVAAFALLIGGGLWLMLWKTHIRYVGLVPVVIAALWAVLLPAPDMLITGDGMHLIARTDAGRYALLRPRTGDYIRDVLSERSGARDPLADLDTVKSAQCSSDLCVMALTRGGKTWRIAATRSNYLLPWKPFITTCQSVDIFVSSRRLPPQCRARWITADRIFLRETGGLAINLASGKIAQVLNPRDQHSWRRRSSIAALPTRPTSRAHINAQR